jgi:L-aspartate oxidase (EC 1.4.3.16)
MSPGSSPANHWPRHGGAHQLIAWGVPFDRQPDGNWHLTREGGHQARRVLHSADTTGHAIESTLLRRALAEPAVQIAEEHYASDLWLSEVVARAPGYSLPGATVRSCGRHGR